MTALSAKIVTHVHARLAEVETRYGIRVLYAAESGSRAWGFASPDSDYDVRFVYAHPLEWYLALEPARDVIEAPLDEHLVDLAGWDVRKALNLGRRANPALHEWLVSPLVYRDDARFGPAARDLFERHADHAALEHHYASIARGQWRSEIETRTEPKLKRYFYVIRPLLALQWVQAHRDTPASRRFPPMALDDIMAGLAVPADVDTAIKMLLAAKRATPELGTGARIAVLDRWISEQLAALEPAPRSNQPDLEADAAYTRLFHASIGFASGRDAGSVDARAR